MDKLALKYESIEQERGHKEAIFYQKVSMNEYFATNLTWD